MKGYSIWVYKMMQAAHKAQMWIVVITVESVYQLIFERHLPDLFMVAVLMAQDLFLVLDWLYL